MKNILSSLNESEKKRILEMHYRASGRHYLNEAVTADYNVIKTSVDATYKETLNKFLMSSVTLGGQDDNGKPTEIIFNPVNKKDTYKVTLGNMSKDVEIYNPTYDCTESSVKDYGWKKRTDSIEQYMKDYANTLGVKEPDYSMARVTLRNGLAKIGLEACKAIDALSKGLPNPLIKLTTSPVKQEEKKALPATKGTGKVVNHRLISAKPTTVITAEDFKKVGLSSEWIPTITDDITSDVSEAPYGGSFYFGNSKFHCGPGTTSDTGKPAYRLNNNGADLYEPLKSAWTTYKTELRAVFIKQCQANSAWLKTAKYQYENEKGEVIRTGAFSPSGM